MRYIKLNSVNMDINQSNGIGHWNGNGFGLGHIHTCGYGQGLGIAHGIGNAGTVGGKINFSLRHEKDNAKAV